MIPLLHWVSYCLYPHTHKYTYNVLGAFKTLFLKILSLFLNYLPGISFILSVSIFIMYFQFYIAKHFSLLIHLKFILLLKNGLIEKANILPIS